MTQNSDLKRYAGHKLRAKRRGIEWGFTFDQWLKVWTDSGKYNQIGVGADKYCMTRVGDCGPYAPWNVRIRTNTENALESMRCMANGDHLVNRNYHNKRKSSGEPVGDFSGWSSRYGEDPLDILMREE